jgi:hypothetical protein
MSRFAPFQEPTACSAMGLMNEAAHAEATYLLRKLSGITVLAG